MLNFEEMRNELISVMNKLAIRFKFGVDENEINAFVNNLLQKFEEEVITDVDWFLEHRHRGDEVVEAYRRKYLDNFDGNKIFMLSDDNMKNKLECNIEVAWVFVKHLCPLTLKDSFGGIDVDSNPTFEQITEYFSTAHSLEVGMSDFELEQVLTGFCLDISSSWHFMKKRLMSM